MAHEAELESFELKPLNTEPELARYLRKSLEAVRKTRWRGEGAPHLKIGGSVRYRRSDILQYLEDCAK